MVPRLLVLALVAVLGGLAGARLGADGRAPSREAATFVRTAATTVAKTPTTAPAATAPRRRPPAAATQPRMVLPGTTEQATSPLLPVPERRRVPAVVGLPEDVAVAELGRAGLRAVVRPQAVSDFSMDRIVLRQFPAAGLRLPGKTPVTVIVGRYTGP